MSQKPTYKNLRKRVRHLEKENLKFKQIKAALKKSEERYQEDFEENTSGKYIAKPDWQLIACNKEYECDQGFVFAPKPGFQNTPHLNLSVPIHFDI